MNTKCTTMTTVSCASKQPLLGITVGDPAGVGPEIACLATRLVRQRPYGCVLYAEHTVLDNIRACTNESRPFNRMNEGAPYNPEQLNIMEVPSLTAPYVFGQVQATCGKAAYDYVAQAIEHAQKGRIDAVVTGPLNKEALNLAGKAYSGHTEIFATLTHTRDYAMLLSGGALRVIHVSTHCALREACNRVTQERVLKVVQLGHEATKALTGIEKPRIAVAGLNPHCGEGGLFGREELDQIIPAVKAAQTLGLDVQGPVPPDTVFLRANIGEYDLVVAMYHDQGHIPLKLVDFMGGVNITAGLPIIRTSVDHGTAFDKAGRGTADPSSMVAALEAAFLLVKARKTC